MTGDKPHSRLSSDKLTKKLVLALCTAHRIPTFSLNKINYIKINTNGVEIVITDIIKPKDRTASASFVFTLFSRKSVYLTY